MIPLVVVPDSLADLAVRLSRLAPDATAAGAAADCMSPMAVILSPGNPGASALHTAGQRAAQELAAGLLHCTELLTRDAASIKAAAWTYAESDRVEAESISGQGGPYGWGGR